MSPHWPFDQPPDCGVISSRQVIHEGAPILFVSHDAEDHGWQFLDGTNDPKVEDGVVVCFSHIVASDSTILELADLPPGWLAWRKAGDAPWVRESCPPDEE